MVDICFLTAQLLFLPLLVEHLDFLWENHLSCGLQAKCWVCIPAPFPPLPKGTVRPSEISLPASLSPAPPPAPSSLSLSLSLSFSLSLWSSMEQYKWKGWLGHIYFKSGALTSLTRSSCYWDSFSKPGSLAFNAKLHPPKFFPKNCLFVLVNQSLFLLLTSGQP